MADDKNKPRKKVKTDARQERLEEALRKNLIKRKAQARARNQKD